MFRLVMDAALLKPGNFPVKGVRYRDWEFSGKERLGDGWDLYEMVSADVGAPGTVAFVFGPKRTMEQALVPFETVFDTVNWQWNAELRALAYLYTGSATLIGSRSIFVPEFEALTKVKIERYWHTEPFSQKLFNHSQPIPTEVENVAGACLHDDVVVDLGVDSGWNFRLDAGVEPWKVQQGAGVRTVPATNFKRNRKYVISDKQRESENGVWIREKQTAFVPRGRPKEVLV